MKNDTNSSASIYLFSSSLPLFFKGKFMLSLPFFLIWVVVISGCSSTGIKDKSQLMLDEMLFGTYGVESLDAVTEEPMFEEATSDSYKLSNTPLREKLNILGEGIKKTVDVLVKSVKGAISGGTAGAVIGGAYACIPSLVLYPACVATMSALGAGAGVYVTLTEPHDTLFKPEGNIPTCNVYYCQPGACGSNQFTIKPGGKLNDDDKLTLKNILTTSIPEKTHHNCPLENR